MLDLLLLIAAQGAAQPPGFWESRTPLEIGMGIAVTALSGTCGTLWAWANGIRRENSEKFEAIAKERAGETRAMIEASIKQVVALEALVKVVEQRDTGGRR